MVARGRDGECAVAVAGYPAGARELASSGKVTARCSCRALGRALDAAAAAASRRPYESSMGVDGPQSSVEIDFCNGMGMGIGIGSVSEGGGTKWTYGIGGIGRVGGGNGFDKCRVRDRDGSVAGVAGVR
jgi:hypothetical protein